MSVIKSLEILLKADNKMLRSDLGKALRDIDSFSSKVNRLTGGIFGSALSKQKLLLQDNDKLLAKVIEADKVLRNAGRRVRRLAQIGLVAGASAAAGLFVSSIRQAIETEKWTVKLAFLGQGGAKLGISLRDELRKIAVKSPFQEEQLFEGAGRLMGAGIRSDEVVGLVKALGDAAAASGTQLNQLALVFSQVFAKDVLQGEEMLQFMERNISLNNELQKIMGVDSVEAIRKLQKDGVLGPRHVAEAFKRLTEEGGRFKDGMLIASKTTQGQFIVLSNLFKIFKDQIGQQVLPVINELARRLVDMFEDGSLKNAAITIGRAFAGVARIFYGLFEIGVAVAKAFGSIGLQMVAATAAGVIFGPMIVSIVMSIKALAQALALAQAFAGPAGWASLFAGIGVAATTMVAFQALEKSFNTDNIVSELERIGKIAPEVQADLDSMMKVLSGPLGAGGGLGGGGGQKLNVAPAVFGTASAGRAFEVRSKQQTALEQINNNTKETAENTKPNKNLPGEGGVAARSGAGAVLRDGAGIPMARQGSVSWAGDWYINWQGIWESM